MSEPNITNRLRQNLNARLKPEGVQFNRLFLSQGDLQSFWNENSDDIQSLLGPQNSSHHQRTRLEADFARITCILLRIEFLPLKLPRLYEQLLDPAQQGFKDEKLPVSLETCEQWLDPIYQTTFCDEQYNLLEPISIQPSQIIKHGRHRRLPFVGEATHIGEGAFGKVIKVKVLTRYLLNDDGSSYPEVSVQ